MTDAPNPAPLVMIVEDEGPMRRFLRTFLAGSGYRLQEAASGAAALQLAAEKAPDITLLDLGLPDMDGQDLLLKLRSWLKTPIVVLSVRDQDTQKITALDHGADDYLIKPFSTGELLARIRVALRHAAEQRSGVESAVFEAAGLRVDLAARRVFVRQTEVHLTPIEFKLLSILVHHSGRVLTHQFLLQQVWGPKRSQNPQHLRVFMAGLRRKIELDPAQPRYLVTEQGVGYRLALE
jgi:two-component system, OmpR family, KDP operon response regulator KdpE